MVIPRFVRQALAGEPITVYGDGMQSRSFTDVHDAVSAMIGLIREPAAVGQVFNVGGGREISITELAELVKKLTGSNSEIAYVPYDQAYDVGFEDIVRRTPDISKLRELIGYAPTIDLPEIILRIVNHVRQHEVITDGNAAYPHERA